MNVQENARYSVETEKTTMQLTDEVGNATNLRTLRYFPVTRFLAASFWVVLLACTASAVEPDRFLFGNTLGQGPSHLVLTLSDNSVVTFSTSQSEFYVGTPNQGWWAPDTWNTNDNDNYSVGSDSLEVGTVNNYFTFDLSGFSGTVASAVLTLGRGYGNQEEFGDGPLTLSYGMWDVSTDAATLNARVNNPNVAIFNDLATGINFGTFELPTTGNPDDVLSLSLDASAIQSIQAAEGSFFSLGGTVTGPTPEPGSIALFGTGVLGLAGILRRKLKR